MPPVLTQRKKKIKDRLKRELAHYLAILTQRIPRCCRKTLLFILAMLAWMVDKRSRCLSHKHLKIAFPEKPVHWRNTMAKQSYKNALYNGADLLWLKEITPVVHNEQVIKQALSASKGVCLLTLHLGSWEAIVPALRKKGYPAQVLTNIPKSFDMLHECYQQADVPYIPRGTPASLIQLMQAIRSGNIICFFSDQYGDEVSVNFFGQHTKAPSGGINLAMMLDAKVVIGWCFKDQHGQDHVNFSSFEIEQQSSKEQTVQHNMQRVMHQFETLIRQHPEQWLWCYNRFKG